MKAGERLRQDLDRFFALRQHGGDQRFIRRLLNLQDWQARRLQRTHESRLLQKKVEPAVSFLLDEVYGGRDLRPIAEEISRALPKAVRLLPDRVMSTSASALEAAIVTQHLDEDLVDRLGPLLDAELDEADYIRAYGDQAHDRLGERQHQLRLIGELGHHMDRYIRSRTIQTSFRMVRRPARAAGFASLYDFLDRAFTAMKPLDSVGELLETIADDEHEILERVLNDDPDPFSPAAWNWSSA